MSEIKTQIIRSEREISSQNIVVKNYSEQLFLKVSPARITVSAEERTSSALSESKLSSSLLATN